MDKFTTFLNAFNELKNWTESDGLAAHQQGYEMNDFMRKCVLFFDGEERQAAMRKFVRDVPKGQREAMKQIALALRLDLGPDYRSCCQQAFMALLGLENYDHEDPKRLLELINPEYKQPGSPLV